MMLFFQAEDGIRDVERSRGLGDVYKRQVWSNTMFKYSLCIACMIVSYIDSSEQNKEKQLHIQNVSLA